VWEKVKTALIVLLGLSALFLLSRTWVYDMERESAEEPAEWAPARQDYGRAAVTPSRCAVTADGVRKGAQYSSVVRGVYQSFRPFLAEHLSAASSPRRLAESEWGALMARDGVYFEYTGSYPLSLLCAWLSVKEGPESGDVTALGLAFDRDQTDLYWRETDGSVWCAKAGPRNAEWPGLTESLSACSFDPSGWLLTVEDDAAYPGVSLLPPPDIAEDLAAYTPFMEVLGMPPLSTGFYTAGGSRVYIDAEGNRSCEIASDGSVFYTGSVPTASGNREPDALSVLRAYDTVTALAQTMGAAEFTLRGVERDGEKLTVTFMVTVGRIPLAVEPAVVVTENGRIASLSLKLCSAAFVAESVKPLDPNHAALLTAKTERLGLCYREVSDGSAAVAWAVIG
jgi:hypothetical protein